MSGPRIPIGGYGEVAFLQRVKGDSKVEARTRFRDWDATMSATSTGSRCRRSRAPRCARSASPVATVINEQASLSLALELRGHTDPKVTIEHYIRRNEQVSRLSANSSTRCSRERMTGRRDGAGSAVGFGAQLPRCSGNQISPLTAERGSFPNILVCLFR